jgi:ribonuclease D
VQITFVDDSRDLTTALATVDAGVVGVDVERADAPRYFRRAALIQVGTFDHVVLVDTVAMPQVPLLHDFLQERTSILHAIHNDLEPLRAAGVGLSRVHDTAVAAAMLGLPVGLDPLLQDVLGVALSPDKERFQRADWEQRPLPDEMLAYAAGDVIHLPALWRSLADRLADSGRQAWYDEEIASVITNEGEDTRDWTRTKGLGRLDGRARAILRHLWHARERLARADDVAPNRLLREATMIDLAERPAENADALTRRNQRRGRPTSEHAEELFAAQQAGLTGPEEPRERNGRWTERERAAYDGMRTVRAEVAREVGLDPGVLCPSRALWAPARGGPTSAQELCDLAGLKRWQTEVLAEPLWQAYTDAMQDDPVPDDEAEVEAEAEVEPHE